MNSFTKVMTGGLFCLSAIASAVAQDYAIVGGTVHTMSAQGQG